MTAGVTLLERFRDLRDKVRLGFETAAFKAEDVSSSGPRDRFLDAGKTLGTSASVLEIGTKQSIEGRGTHSHHAFPNIQRHNYVMADVEPGADVDVVANLHDLPTDWSDRFEAVIASAVFEHLERPWIAAKEVARVLAPGGFCYIATHQTFPLHAYPSDFFRFSREALSLIFSDAGLRIVDVAYEHRSQIVLPRALLAGSAHGSWNRYYPSYVIVHLFAEKPT